MFKVYLEISWKHWKWSIWSLGVTVPCFHNIFTSTTRDTCVEERVKHCPTIKASKALPRAPDKTHIFISLLPFLSPNPIFYHFLESSNQNYTYKWSSSILWRNNTSSFDSSKFHTSYLGLCLLVYRYIPRICDTGTYSFCSVCLSLHKT